MVTCAHRLCLSKRLTSTLKRRVFSFTHREQSGSAGILERRADKQRQRSQHAGLLPRLSFHPQPQKYYDLWSWRYNRRFFNSLTNIVSCVVVSKTFMQIYIKQKSREQNFHHLPSWTFSPDVVFLPPVFRMFLFPGVAPEEQSVGCSCTCSAAFESAASTESRVWSSDGSLLIRHAGVSAASCSRLLWPPFLSTL